MQPIGQRPMEQTLDLFPLSFDQNDVLSESCTAQSANFQSVAALIGTFKSQIAEQMKYIQRLKEDVKTLTDEVSTLTCKVSTLEEKLLTQKKLFKLLSDLCQGLLEERSLI